MNLEGIKKEYSVGFGWDARKIKRKQHILDENGKTYCLLENGSCNINTRQEVPHPTRQVCTTCKHMLKKRMKSGVRRRPKSIASKPNFYASKEWARLRYMAFERYGTRCMVCGGDKSEGVRLHVDHIKPVRKYPELALDINNLQILCAHCNRGKGSEFETDWRHLDDEYRDIMGGV